MKDSQNVAERRNNRFVLAHMLSIFCIMYSTIEVKLCIIWCFTKYGYGVVSNVDHNFVM